LILCNRHKGAAQIYHDALPELLPVATEHVHIRSSEATLRASCRAMKCQTSGDTVDIEAEIRPSHVRVGILV
jgi:hypothetical protein